MEGIGAMMNIIKAVSLASAVSLFAFQSLGANPLFTWSGGGTPDDEGYLLWSDAANWQDGTIPTEAGTGSANAGKYDFSKAAANTKIKCDVSTSHNMGHMQFGENQGTISLV